VVAVLLNPHFDLPFRIAAHAVATVEQDSSEDIANCVECIIRTPNGFREDSPDFGLNDVVFSPIPMDTDALVAQIKAQEPRATVVIKEQPSLIDTLVDTLTVEVRG